MSSGWSPSKPKWYGLHRLAVLLALTSCGAKQTSDSAPSPPPSPAIAIDLDECPAARRDLTSEVTPEVYRNSSRPEAVQSVTIRLQPIDGADPSCVDASTPGCSDPHAALEQRAAQNHKQVECVLGALEAAGWSGSPSPVWYEPLETPTPAVGFPTPIGTELSVLANAAQIDAVARHPYVARIEPAFGEAAKLGVVAPAVPSECPEANEAPDAKLADLDPIRLRARSLVVVELRQGTLPPLRACPDVTACDDRDASGWERSVASTRQLTCVRRFLDTRLVADALDVNYTIYDMIPAAPVMPPFQSRIYATSSFALSLTWSEARELAAHPYVERIWTSATLDFSTLSPPCPRGEGAPIVVPECSSAIEPQPAYLSPEARAGWQAASEPVEALIAVRRSSSLCPVCDDCAERQATFAQFDRESSAAQTCVRALISAIGGVVGESFTLGSLLTAPLSWSQIQAVAAHPDVVSISTPFDTSPPP